MGLGGIPVNGGMRASETASGLLETLTLELRGRNRRVLEAWPFARYIACLDAYPEIAKLGYRSRAVRRACAEIAGLVGEEGLERYHRTLLVSLLVSRASEALRGRNHPEEINLLYEENYQRIVADLESSMNRPGMYRYPLSPFCKDLELDAAPDPRWRAEGPRLPAAAPDVSVGRAGRLP